MNNELWNNDPSPSGGPSGEPSPGEQPEAGLPDAPRPDAPRPDAGEDRQGRSVPPAGEGQAPDSPPSDGQPVGPAPHQPPPYYGGQGPYGGHPNPWQGGYYYSPSQPQNRPPQPPQPPQNFQWNYDEYHKAAQTGGGNKRPKRNRGLVVFTVLLCSALLVGVLFLAGYGLYAVVSEESLSSQSELIEPGDSGASTPSLDIQDKPAEEGDTPSADGRLSTPEVARKVGPSVVGVVEYGAYYGEMYSASGSGIIISADGYILTNAHVVSMDDGSDAEGIEVVLSDGTRKEAWLIGKDSRTDLAVIKIDAQNLPYAEFGNSDQMEIGETVIAIGNPGGEQLAGSVSRGVISGLNRQIRTQEDGYSIDCIQTDAAINPGNSGGPLVNEFGQVIGINSAKLVQTEYEGIGFAIPINDAKPIIDELMAHGRVTNRARLGITATNVPYNYAMYYGLPQGIRIIKTEPEADISTKGLRVGDQYGDIITHLDGEAVADLDAMARLLTKYKAGDQVELTIYRVPYNGRKAETFEITVTLISDSQ